MLIGLFVKADRRPFTVNDFGLEKGNNMDKISFVSDGTLM